MVTPIISNAYLSARARAHEKRSAQVWADEKVATLFSIWVDERSQEQLEGMPFRTQNGPSVAFHYSWHAPFHLHTQTSRGGPVSVARATRLRRRAGGSRVH